MSLRTSAARYARALFDVALKESDPVRIEQDLATIVGAIQQHAELRRTLMSPTLPHAARVNVVSALAAHAGAQPPVAKLVAMLADRNRLELLPDLLDVYRERLLDHQQVVRAAVTTAAPMPEEARQSLESRLRNVTGKHIQLSVDADPSLIGGVVTRIGSTVYDGSIRTQLEKMRQRLIENA